MKNARPLIVILLSIVVGAAAVALAARWVGMQASIATTKVVVAVRDLDVGTRLAPDMLKVVEWPAASPLKEPFSSTDQVRDRVINTQIQRGEPILGPNLSGLGEKGGLSAVLEDGTRAITVKVNEIHGVAGFALPGNYVDVMVNASDDAGKAFSKIVLERILVLAVAQEASASDNKPRVVNAVTLQVTPRQAEQVDLARSIGALSLVLRSQGDKASSETLGARKHDLFKESGLSLASTSAAESAKAAATPARATSRPAKAARKAAVTTHDPEKLEVIRGIKKSVEPVLEPVDPA
jgi:pilus assembly protein CpaB